MPITRDAIGDYEGRIEFWDAATEIAWVAEPVSFYHERSGQRLAHLTALIGAGRGAPISTIGTTDLLLRDASGERRRILQADQAVFLRPVETEPRGAYVEVVDGHLPDVVLEVDYSTDARRGKLGIYEAWGFPELWIDVPSVEPPGRPARRRAGLTIHRLGADGYDTVPESLAFPGWTAGEIHRALNEKKLSEATSAVLTRIGRVLGDAEGTGPDDDPWLREQRRAAVQTATRTAKLDAVFQVLLARGIAPPEGFAVHLADAEPKVLIDAAVACRDAADFLARVRARSPRR